MSKQPTRQELLGALATAAARFAQPTAFQGYKAGAAFALAFVREFGIPDKGTCEAVARWAAGDDLPTLPTQPTSIVRARTVKEIEKARRREMQESAIEQTHVRKH